MSLGEGEVGQGTSSIDFEGVDSCLCIAALLDDRKTVIGGHASLQTKKDKLPSNEILDKMKDEAGGKKIITVALAGDVGGWSGDFLSDKPYISESGEFNYSSKPSTSVWQTVGEKLGVDFGTVHMYKDDNERGTFTVTPQLPPEED